MFFTAVLAAMTTLVMAGAAFYVLCWDQPLEAAWENGDGTKVILAFCGVLAGLLAVLVVCAILINRIIRNSLATFTDVIARQQEELTRGEWIRREFTANVTHELKTPLTSISGYAELIESGMASQEDTMRFVHGIRKNSSRLLNLINDIIRLSELEREDAEEDFEQVNLHAVAQTCVDMLQFSAENHHVTLELEGSDSFVTGSRRMLDELLYNLCDNAIRYNYENGIVKVLVFPEEGRTRLVVQDTGIGIPKESQGRVFERFYRVDKSRSKSTGGTGLGLAIVKHIVAKHEAAIALESEEGKGTKITVTFG